MSGKSVDRRKISERERERENIGKKARKLREEKRILGRDGDGR